MVRKRALSKKGWELFNVASCPISPRNTISQKKPIKPKKKAAKKTREINIYSPEYLDKKHGIKIKDTSNTSKTRTAKKEVKTSLGFYLISNSAYKKYFMLSPYQLDIHT